MLLRLTLYLNLNCMSHSLVIAKHLSYLKKQTNKEKKMDADK